MKNLLFIPLLLITFFYGYSQTAKENTKHKVIGVDFSYKIYLPQVRSFYSFSSHFSTGTNKSSIESDYAYGLYGAFQLNGVELGLKVGYMLSKDKFRYEQDRKEVKNQHYFYSINSEANFKHAYFIPTIRKCVESNRLYYGLSLEFPIILYRGDTIEVKEQYIEFEPGTLKVIDVANLNTAIRLPSSKSFGVGPSLLAGFFLSKNISLEAQLSIYYLYTHIQGDVPVSLKLNGVASTINNNSTPIYTYQYYGTAALLEKQDHVFKGFSNLNPLLRLSYRF